MSSDTSSNPEQHMNFAFSPAQMPGGGWFVAVMVQLGVAQFSFGVPVETALDWLNSFNEQFRAAQRDTKRLSTGLITPTNGNQNGGLVMPGPGATGVR